MDSLASIALSAMLAVNQPRASVHETKVQAEERWVHIARAIARVAEDPPDEWVWSSLQLIRAEVTIANHESDFAWSVQRGWRRGGGAVCLAQIDPTTARRFGFEPESLVGLDDESTTRCFYASVAILSAVRKRAEVECSSSPHWFAPTVAAYGSGRGCVPTGKWVDGVRAREATYVRTGHRKPLPEFALELLGRDERLTREDG